MTPSNAETLRKMMILEAELTELNKLSKDLLRDETKLQGAYDQLIKKINE